MPVPTGETLQSQLNVAISEWRRVKSYAKDHRDAMAAGTVSANLVIQLFGLLLPSKSIFESTQGDPNLVAYAKEQFADASFDVDTTLTNINAGIDAVVTSIIDNFPKSASGHILKDKLELTGIAVRSFTPAQTAGLRTELDGLLAAIG